MGKRAGALVAWKEICARTRAALAESTRLAGWTEKKREEISEKYRRTLGTAKPTEDTDAQRE